MTQPLKVGENDSLETGFNSCISRDINAIETLMSGSFWHSALLYMYVCSVYTLRTVLIHSFYNYP